MAFSLMTITYTGGSRTFPLSFALGFLNRSDIKVNVVGEMDAMGNPVDRAFTFNSDTEIVVTDPITTGSVIRISRTVNKRELPVDFSAPGSATREALDITARYTTMAVQEALDGRIDGSVNSVGEVSVAALASGQQAAAAATAAAISSTSAAASATSASSSETAAATSATAAQTSATAAATSVAAIPSAASQAEAEAGTDNTARMTPLRTSQAITALSPNAATETQATAGNNNNTYMTPLRTQQSIAANTGWTFSAQQTLTAGGTTELLNGVPTGVNEVRVMLTEIVSPTSGRLFIRLGVNNAVYTAGYTTRWSRSYRNAVTQSTTGGEVTGFRTGGWETGETISGLFTLMRLGNTNSWQGSLDGNASRGSFTASGQVILPSALTSIAIQSDTTGQTFRAGGSFIVGWRT